MPGAGSGGLRRGDSAVEVARDLRSLHRRVVERLEPKPGGADLSIHHAVQIATAIRLDSFVPNAT